jgi:hypothetical protein
MYTNKFPLQLNLKTFDEDALKGLLGEELHKQVMEKVGDKKIAVVSDGNWFPKEKFDTVNNDNKELKTQLKQRDTQLEELKTKATGNQELTKQINDLKAANEKTTTEYQQKLESQAFDHALDRAITGAKGKNPKAIKALLDTEKLKLDGEKILGFDDQIKGLKESEKYLFDEQGSNDRGANPGGGGGGSAGGSSMNDLIRGTAGYQ